jgi:hypothetical protein
MRCLRQQDATGFESALMTRQAGLLVILRAVTDRAEQTLFKHPLLREPGVLTLGL